MFDFTSVSHATRLYLSCAKQASSTLSEMRSATLSGCPSPTDSEEKTKELAMRERTARSSLRQGESSSHQDFMMRTVEHGVIACGIIINKNGRSCPLSDFGLNVSDQPWAPASRPTALNRRSIL